MTITDNDSANGPTNPLDSADAQFFVRQQYLDLLGREPTASELTAGAASITQCGSDAACRKTKSVDLSNSILVSQKASGYVFRLYRAAFGSNQPFPIADAANVSEAKKWPAYSVISRDLALFTEGTSFAQKQVEFANSFVLRPEFAKKYSLTTLTDAPTFVDAVLGTILTDTGVDLTSQRTALINEFDQVGSSNAGRAAVMFRLADASQTNPINNVPFVNAEDPPSFASMLHIGYLKRDGNVAGLNSLVSQVQGGIDRKTLIEQFVNGNEYRTRFGPSSSGGAAPVSGVVTYGTAPSGTPKFVPGVAFAAAGSTPLNAASNSVGAYSLNGFGPGAYTITPTKSGDTNGISGLDAARVAQHVAGLTVLTPNQIIAGDATNNGSLSGLDAARIAQTAAGIPNAGIANQWKFTPASRTYPSVAGSLTNENYEAILVGDVTGNWAPPASRAGGDVNEDAESDGRFAEVLSSGRRNTTDPNDAYVLDTKPPANAASVHGTEITLPISIGDTTGRDVLAYDFTLTFDPNVMRPADMPLDADGTLSNGWTIIHNTRTPGEIRVTAFSTFALSGSGPLLNLRFVAVEKTRGRPRFTFKTLELNEGEVRAKADRDQITFVNAASPSEDGLLFEWRNPANSESPGRNPWFGN